MTCGTFTTTDMQADEADELEALHRATTPPPISLTRTQQPNGLFTIVAVFPPCPAGTTHSTGEPAPAAIAPVPTAANLLKGFDANRDCGKLIDKIVAGKVDFVARYYSHNSAKNLSFSEARLLSGAGLKIVAVWEAQGDKAASFSHASGVDDGTSAYNMAISIGQARGTPIYFAVDFDAPQAVVAGPIHDYFQGVADGFASIGHNDPAYTVGVYGSGLVCSRLKQLSLVTHTWLSQSMGWAGSRDFQDWNIRQHLEADPFGFGFTVDPNEAKPDFGGFTT
jgi:hypothetical protein